MMRLLTSTVFALVALSACSSQPTVLETELDPVCDQVLAQIVTDATPPSTASKEKTVPSRKR